MGWLTGVLVGVWNILPAVVKAGAVGVCEVIGAISQAANNTVL